MLPGQCNKKLEYLCVDNQMAILLNTVVVVGHRIVQIRSENCMSLKRKVGQGHRALMATVKF